MQKSDIQQIPLASLQLNKGQLKWLPRNPRQWTQTDIDRMARSLQRDPDFVEERPVLATPGKGGKLVVFAHNLLTEAANAAGWNAVPVVTYTPDTDEDKETIRRRALLDNGSMGRNDTDILANEWPYDAEELVDFGYIDYTGETEKPAPAQAQEDDFNEDTDKVETRCKTGDIWVLGNHRLMCGDSTDADCVAKLMDGEKADMVFTDPPYGVSYTDKNEFLNRIDKPLCVVNPIENDNKSPEEMNAFWKKVFGILADFTTNTAAYYVTSPQGGDLLLLLLAIKETPWALKHTLIWNKNNHILGRCDYNYKHEPIIYGWKKKGTHHFYGGGKFKTSVWDIPKPLRNELHPTMKPIELIVNAILDVTTEGQSVIDLFGGSGSTLIAAEETKRRCFMMEIDPHYCDVILARWEKLTGQTAHKLN